MPRTRSATTRSAIRTRTTSHTARARSACAGFAAASRAATRRSATPSPSRNIRSSEMTKRTFKAKLTADSGGIFFQVPFDVKTEFGKARAPVRVTLGRYTYASTVAVYGGKYYVPVRREHREAARVTPGKTIGIRLELDEAKRDVK